MTQNANLLPPYIAKGKVVWWRNLGGVLERAKTFNIQLPTVLNSYLP
jgi:hypothetical protein